MPSPVPEQTQEVPRGLERQMNRLLNIHAEMAHAPVVLAAYQGIQQALSKNGSFSAKTREAVCSPMLRPLVGLSSASRPGRPAPVTRQPGKPATAPPSSAAPGRGTARSGCTDSPKTLAPVPWPGDGHTPAPSALSDR